MGTGELNSPGSLECASALIYTSDWMFAWPDQRAWAALMLTLDV